jgi:hypothetical protein
MPIPKDAKKLADLLKRLGARNPEVWAASQVQEGINQTHRFLFLRQAWSHVVPDEGDDWIDRQINNSKLDPEAPFAGIGNALSRLTAEGALRSDITEVVRGMQAEFLFSLCYLLDDPSIEEDEVSEVGWTLVETNKDFEPTKRAIAALHESVLDTDPTGREMRPRSALTGL